jgi:hypothetical protein
MLKDVFERLEPCAPKGACTVLRGLGAGNRVRLPDPRRSKARVLRENSFRNDRLEADLLGALCDASGGSWPRTACQYNATKLPAANLANFAAVG